MLKKYLIVDGGGECDYSIMSCASASPAPQRWYMMHWVNSMHQDAGRKDHIISHQHHFVVIYILPNQSHKVMPISKNRRYYNFTSARVLFCDVPTSYISKGSTQLFKMAMVQSCPHSPHHLRYKNGRHLTFSGLHNIPRTQRPNQPT